MTAARVNDSPRPVEGEAVRDLLRDELDATAIHGISVTRRTRDAVYLVVLSSCSWDGRDVLDLRTVVVDLDDEAVRPTDNGIWIPRDGEVSESLVRLCARATSDLSGSTAGSPPATESLVDGLDPDLLLDRRLDPGAADDSGQQRTDMMDRHTGIDPARSWGYGAGPPPEIDRLVERLEGADLDPAEHTTRLVWGRKEPMDRKPRPVDELLGNYGVELLPRSSGLVALDVDYPDEFPADVELPETLEISSPHGSDDQRHILLRCDRKDEIADELGAWAVQSVSWGDLWIGDRYLVGPGSQLSEFGCDDGDHERGEPGGCPACESETGGYYVILSDAPIAAVEPETILELVDVDEGEPRNRGADPDPPGDDEALADDEGRCSACDTIRPLDDLKSTTIGGERMHFCRGGC